MKTATFRFSTDILRRLGEELITSFDQGIVELVKNSYDADATKCTIQLVDTNAPGGTVVITDDGDGMSSEDVSEGWLVLGRSRKVPSERTARNRLPAGSKGLGRLAALRLGKEVSLVTRSRDEPNTEFSTCIRWADFGPHKVVEDVLLPIRRSESEGNHGTRIEIRGLRTCVSEREVKALARELLLLADPFGDPAGFTPTLIAPEFEELESLVQRAYFDDCEYHLVATLDEAGCASAKVFDQSGKLRWASRDGKLGGPYAAPVAEFELWAFLLTRESFSGRAATISEVRSWLGEVGGVRLYHRGLRVRPYGDPGHDWLDMNLARARSPELRPSTNTSIGRFEVLDESHVLLQKTDRSGFIENDAFRELRKFAIEALNWMQDKRIAEREERREVRKRAVGDRVTAARDQLEEAVGQLPAELRQPIERAARKLEQARISEQEQLKEELGLYQTLASVGTAVSVFAHEIEGPATNLTTSLGTVERRARQALQERYEPLLSRQVEVVKQSAELTARFATLPLGLLKRSKRRRALVDVNESVAETIQLFEPYLQDAEIEIDYEFCDGEAQIFGSLSAIEAIVSNLITNSVKAFRRPGAPLKGRRLKIRTTADGNSVSISVLDNGPGIERRLEDKIWLPGVTSDENGTGLGLAIVRDTVADLGGQADAIRNSELGGAEFVVTLPLRGDA
ncbi:MAG: sensor histidine kinase [Chloroflexi bacterium]|nr:sensor histidine kinase [Chloroflexota bacterium]